MKNIVNAGYLMRLLSKETCREAFGVTDVLTDGLTFLQVQVQVQEPEGPTKGEVLLWSTYGWNEREPMVNDDMDVVLRDAI